MFMEHIWRGISKKLNEIQLVKDLTNAALANKMRVSRQRVSQIKHTLADGRAVRPKTLKAVAEAMEVDLQAFFD